MAIFLCFFFGSASGALAQCTLAASDAPALVTVRLGMSPSQVNSALKGALKVKVKGDGHYSLFKSYLKKGKAKGVLTGARAFYLRFYEQRLYQVEIFYHEESHWTDLDAFVRDYSSTSGFDFENFQFKNGYAKAECEGFSVNADYVLNPHIELTDEVVREKVESKK